ncbi:Random slug protein 5 [Fasciolopsis buskii]|uniref:Random slug protein 5 n=1 Tax=Fasciolopsis buskii TaxID=27845 RepID=A0A8E0VN36_9TREM|nr:Random slug protein 5 [Fasciolopsis buski]
MTAQTCHPRIGYDCAQLMSNHYPERLGLAICIRPGPVFKVAWQAMKPFLPPTTVAKVTMVTSKSQLQSVLEQHFSASMVRWIQTEYKLNRKKPTYLRYRNFFCPATDAQNDHDPRGETSYVRDWIEQQHPSGYQPHPNMSEYIAGKLKTPTPSSSFNLDGNGFVGEEEDDDVNEMDEADARKLMASLPDEFQIPADAEKFI